MSQRKSHNKATAPESPHASDDPILPKTPSGSGKDDYEYRCPFCESSYQHELLTRIHVSRSDDPDHLNRNGEMPETEIQVIDKDDEIVESVSRRPEQIDTSAITPDMFPEDFSVRHKQILTVAARNPHETTYTALAETVEQRLDECDTPSYSTVRRVIRRFFRPHIESEKEGGDKETTKETLAGLTAKQQAIVLARVLSSDASKTAIADQVGCSKSYPAQVFSSAESVISDLEKKLDQKDDPVEVIVDELEEGDIRELIERDLLENIPINLETAVTDSEEQDGATWGSPLKHQDRMTAAPAVFEEQCQTTNGEVIEQTLLTENRTAMSKTNTSEEFDNQGGKKSDDSVCETIPRVEIESLHAKVRFLRKTFDGSEANGNEALVSLARQVEKRCEHILREASVAE